MTYSDKIYWQGYDNYEECNPYEISSLEYKLWNNGQKVRLEEMEEIFCLVHLTNL